LTKRLVVLWIAGSGLAVAAGRPDVRDLPSSLTFPTASGWVLTDLNGDLTPDLATAHSSRHDARGYSQEVSVDLGSSGQTSFVFHSRAAKVELRSWDIDGDNDFDIVAFEAVSGRPIGLWLNDGKGSFEEGNLAKYQKSLADDDGPDWRAKNPEPKPLLAIVEQRGQAAVLANVDFGPDRGLGPMASDRLETPRSFRRFDFRTRAPPSNS
jgi:hypothetical protein